VSEIVFFPDGVPYIHVHEKSKE